MMDALQTLVDKGLSGKALDAAITDLFEGNAFEDDDERRYLVALAWNRDCGNDTAPDEVWLVRDDIVKIGGSEYRVLEEDEKEEAWDDYLENYGSECVPGYDGSYFTREQWKKDARMDGPGCLAGYDGHENEFCVTCNSEKKYFYLYRVQSGTQRC